MSYHCGNCNRNFAYFINPGQCPHCRVYASVVCSACSHRAPASEFIEHGNSCPKCGRRVYLPGSRPAPGPAVEQPAHSRAYAIVLGWLGVAVIVVAFFLFFLQSHEPGASRGSLPPPVTKRAVPAAAPAPAPASAPIAEQPGGRILVRTTPAGGHVQLDGVELGTAPLHLDDVAPGEHVLRVELAGYEPVEQRVSAAVGTEQDLVVRLVKRQRPAAPAAPPPPAAVAPAAPAAPH